LLGLSSLILTVWPETRARPGLILRSPRNGRLEGWGRPPLRDGRHAYCRSRV